MRNLLDDFFQLSTPQNLAKDIFEEADRDGQAKYVGVNLLF